MERRHIGVLQTQLAGYSNEWRYDDDFPEKSALRELARLLGQNDNPFRGFLKPGDNVVVKPNWVQHRAESSDSWDALITSPEARDPELLGRLSLMAAEIARKEEFAQSALKAGIKYERLIEMILKLGVRRGTM